jgi:hypothetical protein
MDIGTSSSHQRDKGGFSGVFAFTALATVASNRSHASGSSSTSDALGWRVLALGGALAVMTNDLSPGDDDDFRTHITPKEFEEYISALGLFMHMYGRAESDLTVSILNYVRARLTPTNPGDHFIIQALVGPQRFGPARDSIKRLMRISGATAEQHAEVKRVLDHLGDIQFLRDRIAHGSATPDLSKQGSWWGTSTLTSARELGSGEILYFTPQMLRAAAEDLKHIPDLLFEALSPEMVEAARKYTANEPPNRERDALVAARRAPWRYKPSQLRRVRPKFPANHKSRKPQPSPSRE